MSLGHELSGFLYRTLRPRPEPKGEQIPRVILDPLLAVICAVIQVAATGLEALWIEESGTMSYAMVARMPVSRASDHTQAMHWEVRDSI